MSFDILFLGRLFPREKEQEIKSKMKTGMQDAANVLQWNIIDGLEENETGGKIKIINYLPVDAYPRGYKDKFIEGFTFSHTDKYEANDVNVHCCNIYGIKRFINIRYFKKYVKKWAKEKSDKPKYLFLYTATSMFFNLGAYAKRINPDIRVVCLIADIPKYATTSTLSGLRKIYHDYEVKKCEKLYGVADKYILLTEHMATHLGIRTPYMVMEGIATSVKDTEIEESVEEYGKYILYTGLLNEKFGIPVLLDAFGKIKDENVKLVLCGTGDAQELIAKKQSEDNRIIAPGKVDRKKALALQRGAAVLVNPRQNNEEFTKYSFPSKNLEYLSSGVPVVAYKLDGIPDEYDDYINYPADDSADAMCKEFERLLEMTDEERKAVGRKAKDFVLGTKNRVQQTKRIIDFLST